MTDEDKLSLDWNVQIANPTSLLRGTATPAPQAALRELAKAGGATTRLARATRFNVPV